MKEWDFHSDPEIPEVKYMVFNEIQCKIDIKLNAVDASSSRRAHLGLDGHGDHRHHVHQQSLCYIEKEGQVQNEEEGRVQNEEEGRVQNRQ